MSKRTKINPLPNYLQYKELVDNLSKDVDAKVTGGVEKMHNDLSVSLNQGLDKLSHKLEIEGQKRNNEAAIERQIAESRILGLENRLAQKVADNNKYQTKLLLSIMGIVLTLTTGVLGIIFRKPLVEGFTSLFR